MKKQVKLTLTCELDNSVLNITYNLEVETDDPDYGATDFMIETEQMSLADMCRKFGVYTYTDNDKDTND